MIARWRQTPTRSRPNNTPITTALQTHKKSYTRPPIMTANHPTTPYLNYKYYVKPNTPLISLLLQPRSDVSDGPTSRPNSTRWIPLTSPQTTARSHHGPQVLRYDD